MILAQNWPKTAKSSWHCSFKLWFHHCIKLIDYRLMFTHVWREYITCSHRPGWHLNSYVQHASSAVEFLVYLVHLTFFWLTNIMIGGSIPPFSISNSFFLLKPKNNRSKTFTEASYWTLLPENALWICFIIISFCYWLLNILTVSLVNIIRQTDMAVLKPFAINV